MKEKAFLILITLILLSSFASAAVIHGTIYNLNLDKQSNARVSINTLPEQFYISKNGTYTFNVPSGDYEIKAEYYKDTILESSAEENISIKTDGIFIVDLILFPNYEEENELLREDIVIEDSFDEETNYYFIIAVIALAVIFTAYYFYKRKKKKPDKEEKKEVPHSDLNQILKIIKAEGGRTTQKEIRKKIPLSEAKISLMIAQLEHEGKIKKIKKGRGNIILLT